MLLSDAPGDSNGAGGPRCSEPRGVSGPATSIFLSGVWSESQLMSGIAVRGVGGGLQSLHQNIMNISAERIPH